MPLMEWSHEYSVGSSKMDNEHKMIFSLMNEFHGLMEAGESHAALAYVFTAMKAYSVYHFTSEIKLLTEKNYPDLEAQKQSHAEFVQRIADFEKDVARHEPDIGPKVMIFLKAWWINHIQKEDKKYAPYME